jgi:hypothetical protein
MKYLGKIKINKRKTPIFITKTQGSSCGSYYQPQYFVNNIVVDKEGYELKLNKFGKYDKLKICTEYYLYKFFNKINIIHHHHGSGGNDIYSCHVNDVDIVRNCKQIFDINNMIYVIIPVYEYPDYSTDEEINEIYKKKIQDKIQYIFCKNDSKYNIIQ